ncbi:MAG: SDR family NAD(P)-dependent oxidoreductase [Rhodobacteraceae bacterium]|nr:SDR family NAD(P)-dependent oxidoreductase [Paracoccaceae bacterium]
MDQYKNKAQIGENDIAIIGMSAHLPGADGLDAYWDMLSSGTSAIRRFSEDELRAAGEDPAHIARRDYVPFAAPLEGFADFEPEFFGFSPKEAAIMDPQHRQFLETGWEALENAGHMPENFEGPIGVYAGCGMGSYFYFNICSNPDIVDDVGLFLLRHTGNDKDFLSTRLSHVFDLRGPSINVQTACSTSLVATHYAAQALLNGECDMAIAGGVTVELPQGRGYIYKEGEVLSPDGECHAFDHRAEGTVFGSGAGAVILRRAEDAIADGDHIWAIIKGSAVNNDGADKAGYLAPSVGGQAAAIADALALAEVTADTVDYVECHGTGTYLGDPIEIAAMTEAFRETTDEIGYCRIGSVKTNIGHLDTAAGVASLIKASLALERKIIPASLGYEAPNPAIEFDTSPFRVNDQLTDWISHKGPRRAGVNSLGVGGTNAYAVLEEAPERPASEESDWPFHVLTLSARSKAALDDGASRLAQHLRANRDQPLADVAWTLKEGRRGFEKRRVVVAETHEEAADLLEGNDPRRVFTHDVLTDKPDIAFMFPGGGAQYAGMARDLYETEPVFAEWMDKGLEILAPKLDYDIRALWLPEGEEAAAEADEKLKQPSVQLPLIMICEYALAQLWIGWGVRPSVLVGHSMGENTAACLAGVISFADCIGLVHLRGTLFDTVPAGGMVSVPLPVDELRTYLGDTLDIAAVNAPGLSVATGPDAELDALAERLKATGIEAQRIPINIAAHSRMLEPILDRFRAYLASIPLNPPQIPFVSNRTGALITDAQATDPNYWVEHLRNTIHFADCITTLAKAPGRVLIEVGPGKALSTLAQIHPDMSANQVIHTLRHPGDEVADDAYFLAALGRLWALGARIDWAQIWGEAKRQRVVLPTYAFQRATYFIEPGEAQARAPSAPMRQDDMADWGYAPVWRKKYADCPLDVTGDMADVNPLNWLIFQDETGVSAEVVSRLRKAGHRVISVRAGDAFAGGGDEFTLAPEMGREGYDQLIGALVAEGRAPDRIGHFWQVSSDENYRAGSSFFHRNLEQGFYSLLFLAQALSDESLPENVHIAVFTSGAVRVRDEALPYPEKAATAGPARVIPREMPGVSVSTLDIALSKRTKRRTKNEHMDDALIEVALEELLAKPANLSAALRGTTRFELSYGATPLADKSPDTKDESTWLITGGFGGIGLTIAADLIDRHKARIALLSRTRLPDRKEWPRATGGEARRIAEVKKLEALGGKVMVISADVSNVEEMQAAKAKAEAEFGTINGVIHAAGVVDDAPFATKSVAGIEDVFTPKIHGTQVLEQVFPDGSIDWLILFSSSSTATAPAGQIDYVAANEYLNAYAKSRVGGATKVKALDWGIWADTGMAAEMVATRDGGHEDGPAQDIDAPLLGQAFLDGQSDRVFTGELSVDDWIINEHRLASGEALLPGTGYLELAAEALAAQGEVLPYEIHDLNFLRALNISEDAPRDIRVRLKRTGEGYLMDIRAAQDVSGRAGYVLNAEALLAFTGVPTPSTVDIPALWSRCTDMRKAAPGAILASAQEAHLNFGPRWKVLRKTALGDKEGVAELALPADAIADLRAGFTLHPALLDIATGWAMELIPGYHGDHLWVPVSYGAVRIYRALPAQITSWVMLTETTPDAPYARFDVALVDDMGRTCVEVEGFSIRRIDDGIKLDLSAQPAPSEVEFTQEDHDTGPLSAAEERLRHNLTQGITADQGAEAFRRALAQDRAQVFVSSMPLPDLIAQTGADEVTSSAQKFERPALEQDYIAPEGNIETTLAGFWEDFLGVSQIGAEDSFFDLGGHSLIAVRLFARIRKTWGVDFAISTLFEAPTIRKISALLGAEGVAADMSAGDASDITPAKSEPRHRFTHLVAMHDGEGGAETPFFLVAGMFGNVLNLRHLAHLIGADRPFYGLQARGLLGDEAPHTDVADAASDMIAEMRQVQPHGPYLLGGFSGGGITAYEIAGQLEAMGEEVAIVVLLDTPLPVRRSLSRRDRALIQWAELKRNGPSYILKWAANRVKWELTKRRGGQSDDPADNGPQFHNAAIEAAFLTSVGAYQLKPWPGNLVLFRPPPMGHWQVSGGQWVDSQRAYLLADNDWSGYASGLRVHEVPGDHDSMVLEPNVRVLAGRMRAELEAVKASVNGAPVDPASQAKAHDTRANKHAAE